MTDHLMDKSKKQNIVYIALMLLWFALLFMVKILGESDAIAFLRWYLTIAVMGLLFFPLAKRLFSTFADGGWLFSKVLAIALTGYLTWALTCLQLLSFTAMNCRIVTGVLLGLLLAIAMLRKARRHACGKKLLSPESKNVASLRDNVLNLKLILLEEVLFLAFFLLWTYIAAFHPAASGTEKFMDFGFMQVMMRSDVLPAKDIWYGTDSINYYYGGQYFAVFLTKLTGTQVRQTYNLARTLVAAFAFALPFSLVWNMLAHRLQLDAAGLRRQASRESCSVKEQSEQSNDREQAPKQKAAEKRRSGRDDAGIAPYIGGLLAGMAVSLAGNMHYVLYGLFGSLLQLPGYEDYWFPDSTRFIGYNPVTEDQCIHEFPSYSFVLGDLHAHVVNIMFVLLLIAILYAWLTHAEKYRECTSAFGKDAVKLKETPLMRRLCHVLPPELLLCGWLAGMFQWTNYWDFIIYLTVIFLASMIYAIWCEKVTISCEDEKDSPKGGLMRRIIHMLLRDAIVLLLAMLSAIPFRMHFQTMVSGVALAGQHTAIYQWLVLWGLPLVILLVFVLGLTLEGQRRIRRQKGFFAFSMPDLFGFLLGCCGLGLVLIPELVYVKDIYEANYPRANTMFKLSYQAFIMFGMMMAYALVRNLVLARRQEGNYRHSKYDMLAAAGKKRKLQKLFIDGEKRERQEPSIAGEKNEKKEESFIVGRRKTSGVKIVFSVANICLLLLLMLTMGYFPYAVGEWFGNVSESSAYQGLDATAFLEASYPQDAGAIRWLQENVQGTPIVLEAEGDSYSDHCRVSAMTGLPTVMGWYVHEWLWRNDPGDLNQRMAEIEEIYTTTDEERARALLDKYEVSYIFIGSCERESYPALNETLLRSLGELVYENPEDIAGGAIIIKLE